VATAYLRSLRHGLNNPVTANALMALAAEADRALEAAHTLAKINEDRHQAFNELLAPSGTQISPDEFSLLIGPVMSRRFIDRQPITDAYLESVVTGWLAATFRPTHLRRSPS
jgi:hypothetical protein